MLRKLQSTVLLYHDRLCLLAGAQLISTQQAAGSDEQRWTTRSSVDGIYKFDHISRVLCDIGFILVACWTEDTIQTLSAGLVQGSMWSCIRTQYRAYLLSVCVTVSCLWQKRTRPIRSSTTAVLVVCPDCRQISENVLSPCLHTTGIYGTGCEKRSGMFSRFQKLKENWILIT